jgi:hypothetical protein
MDEHGNLVLGIGINEESHNFYVDEDELFNIDKFLQSKPK